MSLGITDHFTIDELRSHDGEPYPLSRDDEFHPGRSWLATRLLPLCKMLEVIREACGGKPMTIVSGYRSPDHNAKIGGAKFSQHMEGRAVDIKVSGMTPAEVHSVIMDLYAGGKISDLGGCGEYPNWNHVDVRPKVNGHLAQWDGFGIGSEIA